MTTNIDHDSIERDVASYYRYATLSHTWEGNEPLFEKVVRIVVYDLEESVTHDKLRIFCKIVRDAGLHWAWSDTCCINKADHFVLQETLVAMFKWYSGSAVTIVLLRGVGSPSRRGDLVRSIWNTRAWPLQEYLASKVVRFYNEDWTLYRNIDIPNHKESLEIISEMEEAMGISTRALMTLRPNLGDICQKLRLASTREATLVEDTAYSLLGIFAISLPVVYGEGDRAIGRLLAQLLASSGDTTILAWKGRSGSFNSCLPASITVYNELPHLHVPLPISGAEMESIILKMHASSLNHTSSMALYDRLNGLPPPIFSERRLRLPCLTFKLAPVTEGRRSNNAPGFLFRARADSDALGVVEIRTTEHLSQLDSLYLVHPWIDFLLNRQPYRNSVEEIVEKNTDDSSSFVEVPPVLGQSSHITLATPKTRAARLVARFERSLSALLRDEVLAEKQIQALQLIVRIGQPFGALLLTPIRVNGHEYRRVAASSLITVQVQEATPGVINDLLERVRVLDVL